MIRHTTVRLVLAALAISATAGAQEDSAGATWADALDVGITPAYQDAIHRSFDFWIGDWDVNWRSQQPDEFHHQKVGSWTRNRVFPILGGKALMEITWDRDKPEQAQPARHVHPLFRYGKTSLGHGTALAQRERYGLGDARSIDRRRASRPHLRVLDTNANRSRRSTATRTPPLQLRRHSSGRQSSLGRLQYERFWQDVEHLGDFRNAPGRRRTGL